MPYIKIEEAVEMASGETIDTSAPEIKLFRTPITLFSKQIAENVTIGSVNLKTRTYYISGGNLEGWHPEKNFGPVLTR